MTETNIIIYNTTDGKASVALYTKDGKVWLTQKQLSELFDTSRSNITKHIVNILEEGELEANSVCEDFSHTAEDGKEYTVNHYSLSMILALGFRVKGIRGTQFRQWANRYLQEYMVKGFVMDDERLKNPDGRPDYFDEMLARIRDIRTSEKRFYQKIRDLFSLSNGYDKTDKATQMFFAEAQNKLLFAITNKTAAEIVCNRADAKKENMGLLNWKGSIVRKGDIIVAKNYLNEDEIDSLNRLTIIFLETAELRAKNKIDTTMKYWCENIDKLITDNEFKLLSDNGSISKEQMKETVGKEYNEFHERRLAYDIKQADKQDENELKELEDMIKSRRL